MPVQGRGRPAGTDSVRLVFCSLVRCSGRVVQPTIEVHVEREWLPSRPGRFALGH